MGKRQTNRYNLNEVSKEKQRFMSVGEGTTVISNRDEWRDAVNSLRAKLEEAKNASRGKR